jgi:hypothetical protein
MSESSRSRVAGVLRVCAVLAAVLLGGARPSRAQVDFSQDELRSLPRVCLAQTYINGQLQFPVVPEEERKQWAQKLGEKDYSSYHHYCWALLYIRRANSVSTPTEKNHNFVQAIENFNYVQRNASVRFPLLPEVNLQKALTLRLMGQDAAAASELMTAIKLKRDYTPAYAALIDIHLDLGNQEAAQSVLQEGLMQAPNSKILTQKKLEIDGRTPSSR